MWTTFLIINRSVKEMNSGIKKLTLRDNLL